MFDDLTWTCHICHRERPDAMIGVYKSDLSADWGLPPGTMLQNVRYCLDDPACVEASKTFRFVEPAKR